MFDIEEWGEESLTFTCENRLENKSILVAHYFNKRDFVLITTQQDKIYLSEVTPMGKLKVLREIKMVTDNVSSS